MEQQRPTPTAEEREAIRRMIRQRGQRESSATSISTVSSLSMTSNNPRGNINVFADPPEIHNVSATPNGSADDVVRCSLASEPAISDGYMHAGGPLSSGASVSSGLTGQTLNRSNTTGTSNSSTLYSIPSQLSGPPSPLQSVAPTRPRFDYERHQQTVSVHDSELGSEVDPFSDTVSVGVADGFAEGARSVVSESSTLPPPYTQYPDVLPKNNGEEDVGQQSRVVRIDLGVQAMTEQRGDGGGGGEGGGGGQAQGATAGAAGSAAEGGGGGEDVCGATKEWKERKWTKGRPTLTVCAMIAALLVGLGVGLGAGLGIGLAKGKSATKPEPSTVVATIPSPEHTEPAVFDPTNSFPDIPTGPALIAPLELDDRDTGCTIGTNDQSAPNFFKQAAKELWSCNIPDSKPLLWNFFPLPTNLTGEQLGKLKSVPAPLQFAEYEKGKWGGYVVTSREGSMDHGKKLWSKGGQDSDSNSEGDGMEWAGRVGFREGVQGPSFWRQPLTFVNGSKPSTKQKRHRPERLYRFGILYNKTVILKESTLEANKGTGGSGDTLQEGDVAWKCVWDKTLLEVELSVDENIPPKGKDGTPATIINPYNEWEWKFFDDPNAAVSSSYPSFRPPPPPPSSIPTQANTPAPTPLVTEVVEVVVQETISSDEGGTQHEDDTAGEDGEDGEDGDEDEGQDEDEDQNKGKDKQAMPNIDPEPVEDPDEPSMRQRRTPPPPPPPPPKCYPKEVRIRETRPTRQRLKDVQGIDRTEGDNDERARMGSIKCTKMVVIAGGALRRDVGADGEGQVELYEAEDNEKLRKRGTEMGTGCRCSWTT